MKVTAPYPRSLLLSGAALLLLALQTGPAQALPSFARQTGEECAACHIGGFGPQLTPHGMRFKLGGYTDTDGNGLKIPLSAMVVGSFTHTAKEVDTPDHSGNDKWDVPQASLFLAGRWNDWMGSFIQATTSSDADGTLSMDNADIRLAHTVQLAGDDTILGLSFNNNPTVSDPFNTLPAWRFPYMSSDIIAPMASPLLSGGLSQQVGGVSAYAFWNDSLYAELGGYQALSRGFLGDVNVDPNNKIDGTAPYWRLAYTQDRHRDAWSLGVFGMNADVIPNFKGGRTDNRDDIGVDASYEFLGNRKNIFTLNTSYIHEHNKLAATDPGDKANLNRFDLAASYYYDQSYGLSLGLFDINGTTNHALYPNSHDGLGSRSGSPDSRGYILQADWTPFGKEGDQTWANLRLGLQYTGYTKFNGASNNYDGAKRDAGDNNTLFAFLWTAF